MVFTNEKEEKVTCFEDLDNGDYFRINGSFYMKLNMYDEDGDYYGVNLETGDTFTFCDEEVEPIDIKEIIYVNKK